MISKYDPLSPPNPEKWLELDEAQRMQIVMQYHKKAGIETPNDQIHALIHTIIENQNAQSDKYPVKDAIERLMEEGLDRHEAIHALGSVLIKHMMNKNEDTDEDESNNAYFEDVRNLTVQKWKEEFS